MRKRSANIPLMLLFAISMAACVTQQSATPTSKATVNGQTQEAHSTSSDSAPAPHRQRKLPKAKLLPMATDPYPEQGKRRNLQGRVLVEFAIDPRGAPVSVTISQADADPVLQAGALKLMRAMRYDVTSAGFDAAESLPFRLTIKFCLPDCTGIATFPDSEELTIRGGPLLPAGR
jgi:TonB family protein